MKPRLAWALALGALFLAPESHAAPPPIEDVAFAGCASVADGPICRLGEDPRLVIWWAEPADGAIEVRVDGDAVAFESNRVGGGRQLIVRPPALARTLVVRLEPAGAEPVGWRLALAAEPTHEGLERALGLRRAGELDAAEAALVALASDPEARARAMSARGRIAIARGDGEAAERALEEAIRLHDSDGELALGARDAIVLAFVQHKMRHDFSAAERTLDEVTPRLDVLAEHRTDVLYERSALAIDSEQPADALRLATDAESWARRMAMDDARWMANQVRIGALTALGRASEADALLSVFQAEVEGANANPCVAGHLYGTRAWLAVLARERDPATVNSTTTARALGAAARAAELFAGDCRRDATAADHHVNRALLLVQAGRAAEARAELDRAGVLLPEPHFDLESWMLDAEARATQLEGDEAAAAAAFRELRQRAEDLGRSGAAWRASWGLARSAATRSEEVAALQAAERALEAELRGVPVGAGRDTLAARRAQTAAALVARLFADGDLPGAMAAARRGQSRALRALARDGRIEALTGQARAQWRGALARYRERRAGLDERLAQRWAVPAEGLDDFDGELRAQASAMQRELDDAYGALGDQPSAALHVPPEGTLLWLAQPLRDGWLLLAQRGEEVRAQRREDLTNADSIGEWAWGPFDDWIADAERVAIVAPAAIAALDPHAGRWRGAPLIAQREVVYSLDLAPRPRTARAAPTLLVTDPSGNLRGARREHALLARALGDRAVSLVGDDATRGRVLDALPTVGALHFAGHGVRGASGWDHGVALAQGARLTPADVLSAAGVPELVVLSGCETGATSADAADVQGLGLATAFLLAGSRTVVATSRPVSDAAASHFTNHLVRVAPDGRPSRATLRASLIALGVESSGEWRSYRVITSDLGGVE